jgi:hypothetical protein
LDKRNGGQFVADAPFANGKFFLRFSAVAWSYQWHRAARQKIKVNYDDCYFRCPEDSKKEWDETRRNFCDECPHRTVLEAFFNDDDVGCVALFRQRFDEELTRSEFNKWVSLVKNVAAYEGTTENIGVKHSHLLTAYLTEKDKYERAIRKDVKA